jgi:mannose-6-phosphate isomerase-like protein (cupin superfamily)
LIGAPRQPSGPEEHDDADQASGFATLRQGTGRLVHRHRADRSALRRERTGARRRIVTFGRGWVQREGEPIQEIRPGDVIWFEPGEKHWHGATATTAMQHIAIQEALDGKAVDWMEKVSDQQYQAGPAAT